MNTVAAPLRGVECLTTAEASHRVGHRRFEHRRKGDTSSGLNEAGRVSGNRKGASSKGGSGRRRKASEPEPATPHDALFKATFSRLEHARAMLRSALPPSLSRLVTWSSLRRRPGSFVDEGLRQQHTDLLFAAKLRERAALFYLLFEHQSTSDPWMLLRLLQYMVRVWREHLERHPRATRLPVIVPIVLHHSETGWVSATAFEELMDVDDATRVEVRRYVPRFEIALDDVSRVTDEELRGRAITALGKLVLACFRHARDMRTLLGNLRPWTETVAEVRRTPNGLRAFALVLRYIFQAADEMEPEEVRELVEGKAAPEVAEEIVSLAEKLIEKGRQEGVQKGLREGLREGLQKGLQKGLQEGRREGLQEGVLVGRADTVLKLLRLKFGKVSAANAARVRAATKVELDAWMERVLTAGSIGEVLDE